MCEVVVVQDEHLWLKAYKRFFFFRKWQTVWLDYTCIPQLGSCRDFEAALKLTLITISHYMEKNPGMFSLKTLISFRLKKERHEHLE